jgi:hypothetical protein
MSIRYLTSLSGTKTTSFKFKPMMADPSICFGLFFRNATMNLQNHETASVNDLHQLSLLQTARFAVLSVQSNHLTTEEKQHQRRLSQHIPIIALEDLLLHQHRACTRQIQDQLFHALYTQGFCLLTTPKHSRPSRLIDKLQTSLKNDLFPASDDTNAAHLQTSKSIYISERDIPMYRLGYERTPDNIRQVYRIAAGRPDEQPWPSTSTRQTWLQALGLMRHVTDVALDLLLKQQRELQRETKTNPDVQSDSITTPSMRSRPYSDGAAWLQDKYSHSNLHSLTERSQDYSVLYVMHYFGNSLQDEPNIAVKQHVDPSLLVMEPFLCCEVQGLQVWDRSQNTWLDCDGPESPLHNCLELENMHVMLLFVGKGLQAHIPSLEPTLHRVVASHGHRRTVIYEQKYGEFYL